MFAHLVVCRSKVGPNLKKFRCGRTKFPRNQRIQCRRRFQLRLNRRFIRTLGGILRLQDIRLHSGIVSHSESDIYGVQALVEKMFWRGTIVTDTSVALERVIVIATLVVMFCKIHMTHLHNSAAVQ